jgi:hypothetical protein
MPAQSFAPALSSANAILPPWDNHVHYSLNEAAKISDSEACAFDPSLSCSEALTFCSSAPNLSN